MTRWMIIDNFGNIYPIINISKTIEIISKKKEEKRKNIERKMILRYKHYVGIYEKIRIILIQLQFQTIT